MMNAALATFLSANAAGALPGMPVDDVYDMISAATDDAAGLAKSFGLALEPGPVNSGTVARPLVDAYFDALARSDGGALDAVAQEASRSYRERRHAVATTLGQPETDVDEAYEALDAGHPEAFDRLFSRYYGM